MNESPNSEMRMVSGGTCLVYSRSERRPALFAQYLRSRVHEFGRFVQACPKVAEAHQLLGSCLVRQGHATEARASFDSCVENASGPAQQKVREQCIRLRDGLGGQGGRP